MAAGLASFGYEKAAPGDEPGLYVKSLLECLFADDGATSGSALAHFHPRFPPRGCPSIPPVEMAAAILGRMNQGSPAARQVPLGAGPTVVEYTPHTKATYQSAPRKALLFLGRIVPLPELCRLARSDARDLGMRIWAVESIAYWFSSPGCRTSSAVLQGLQTDTDRTVARLGEYGLALVKDLYAPDEAASK
jgi:hypothetical protein